MLCYCLGVSCRFFLKIVGYQVWFILNLIVYIPQPFLVSRILRWRSPLYWIWFYPQRCIVIFLKWNNGCVFWVFPFYRCWGFPFARKSHPRRCGSLGWILCLTFTLIFAVSLWGVSCVGLLIMLFSTLGKKPRSLCLYVVCLKISAKFRIACNLIYYMDTNWAVGAGFEITSIQYSATLVAASW